MKRIKKYYLFQMKPIPLNILSCLLFIALMAFALYTTPDLFRDFSEKLVNINILLFFISFLAYLILHEILHSIAYVIYGGKFDKIVYGMALEKGILYCLCKQNVSRNNILHSLMYPLFFIGIVTYILSIIFHLPLLFFLSIFNLSGCSGDIIMFLYISKLDKDIEFTELDDEMSFAIYSDKDVSKISHFGLKYINAVDEVERKDFKKVKISKTSKIILILILIVCLLTLII